MFGIHISAVIQSIPVYNNFKENSSSYPRLVLQTCPGGYKHCIWDKVAPFLAWVPLVDDSGSFIDVTRKFRYSRTDNTKWWLLIITTRSSYFKWSRQCSSSLWVNPKCTCSLPLSWCQNANFSYLLNCVIYLGCYKHNNSHFIMITCDISELVLLGMGLVQLTWDWVGIPWLLMAYEWWVMLGWTWI